MAIPDFQSVFLPFLQLIADDKEHSKKSIAEQLAKEFALSPEEQKEMVPSGRESKFVNRVGWTKSYLKMAGLLEYTRRSYCRITQKGLDLIAKKPQKLNTRYLRENYPEFTQNNTPTQLDVPTQENNENLTPMEQLDNSYRILSKAFAEELLEEVKRNSSDFFELLVLDLLVAMGYGGEFEGAIEHRGKSGDAGIDGVINEDPLGLGKIYLQAKKWGKDNVIGRPEIQKFVGALVGQKASIRKGVFLTTSSFSDKAIKYANDSQYFITLIDGELLVKLMMKHNLGCTVSQSYEIKRIDADYFDND